MLQQRRCRQCLHVLLSLPSRLDHTSPRVQTLFNRLAAQRHIRAAERLRQQLLRRLYEQFWLMQPVRAVIDRRVAMARLRLRNEIAVAEALVAQHDTARASHRCLRWQALNQCLLGRPEYGDQPWLASMQRQQRTAQSARKGYYRLLARMQPDVETLERLRMVDGVGTPTDETMLVHLRYLRRHPLRPFDDYAWHVWINTTDLRSLYLPHPWTGTPVVIFSTRAENVDRAKYESK